MPLIKMISSGLVIQNKGYGTYPSTYVQHENDIISPSIPLRSRPMPNQVVRAPKRKASEMIFPSIQYEYLFPKYDYSINALGPAIGISRPYGPSVNQQTQKPAEQPTTVPTSETQAPKEQPMEITKPVEQQVSVARKALGLAGAAVPATLSLLNSILGFSGNTPLTILGATFLPPELFQFLTQTSRLLQDEKQRTARAFSDAVVIPATQLGARKMFDIANNALFAEGGVLGPGWVSQLAQILQSPQTISQITSEGNANAIRSLLGPDAPLSTGNLVRLFSQLAVYSLYPAMPVDWVRSLFTYISGSPVTGLITNYA